MLKESSWKRFGYHVVYDADIYDAINFASTHGFGYIVPDLMIPRFFPERFNQQEDGTFEKLQRQKTCLFLFTAHHYLNLGAIYPEIRKAVLDRMKLCLDFACDVEAQRFTIHISLPFDFVFAGRMGTYLKDHWMIYKDTLKRSLLELTEYPQGDVLVCVEDDRLSKMAMEVLEEVLPTRKLFLTWDIAKSYTATGEPIVEVVNFLMEHLEKVRECHLHDQKPGKYSHDILGVGKIDFSYYLKILMPRDVCFTLEIRPREKALESLRILKDMLKSSSTRIDR